MCLFRFTFYKKISNTSFFNEKRVFPLLCYVLLVIAVLLVVFGGSGVLLYQSNIGTLFAFELKCYMMNSKFIM